MPIDDPQMGDGDATAPLPDDAPPPDDAAVNGLVRLALLAVVAGALTGVVTGLFRVSLMWAAVIRDDLLVWTREAPVVRWAVPMVCAGVAVGVARLVVRWVPEASGSGVQRVEASMRGELPLLSRLRIVPAKFIGGVLALGAGLALGREGPSVQMGAVIGNSVARWTRLTPHDTRTLSAAMAGAGLGVAFSAPLGGALFVFEEVAHAFRTRLVVSTLIGSGTALAVARLVGGGEQVFHVGRVDPGPLWQLVAFALLGLLLGGLGVAYNRMTVWFLDRFETMTRLPAEVKAGIFGAFVGLLGILSPSLIGGGEVLNQRILVTSLPIAVLVGVLLVRVLLGPASYSLGTPGGLFAPLLLVGAAMGALIAEVINVIAPMAQLSPTAFAIVGMAAFFTAVVRAPFTGVLLVVEMTATTSVVIPMVIAAAAAVLAATLLRGEPIYDTLRGRLPSVGRTA